ncbi:MAG: hypothetical protein ACYC8T_33790 [Myxococcaceae bacterium]
MPSRADAKAIAKKLHALSGGAGVTRKAAAREIARLDPTDATELIHHLLLLAREGWEPATCVLAYFVSALGMEASQIPYAGALKRLALLQELEPVAALFADGPAAKQMDPNAAAKADAKLFTSTLGHLKSRARMTTNPDELSKLAVASNASVVRNVLLNPRLTEDLVVRIAARRPARPEPLIEIWRSARWSVRHAVRRALVFNPYLPPEVGAKIVPLLSTTDLAELAQDSGVHEALRDQARALLAASLRRR